MMLRLLRIWIAQAIAPELALPLEPRPKRPASDYVMANFARGQEARILIAAFEMKHGRVVGPETFEAVTRLHNLVGAEWRSARTAVHLIDRLKDRPDVGCRAQSLSDLRWFLDKCAQLPTPLKPKKEAA